MAKKFSALFWLSLSQVLRVCTYLCFRSGAFVKARSCGNIQPALWCAAANAAVVSSWSHCSPCFSQVKRTLKIQRSVLGATQRNRASRFASCAKHAHSSGSILSGLLAGSVAAALTSRSSRSLRLLGQQNPRGFCCHCAQRCGAHQ